MTAQTQNYIFRWNYPGRRSRPCLYLPCISVDTLGRRISFTRKQAKNGQILFGWYNRPVYYADVRKDKPKPKTVKCKRDEEDKSYETDLIYGWHIQYGIREVFVSPFSSMSFCKTWKPCQHWRELQLIALINLLVQCSFFYFFYFAWTRERTTRPAGRFTYSIMQGTTEV